LNLISSTITDNVKELLSAGYYYTLIAAKGGGKVVEEQRKWKNVRISISWKQRSIYA